MSTCPGPTAPNFFGALFSFDAQHPSSLAHRIIANEVIRALNAKHGLSIPLLALLRTRSEPARSAAGGPGRGRPPSLPDRKRRTRGTVAP